MNETDIILKLKCFILRDVYKSIKHTSRSELLRCVSQHTV